MKALAWLLWLLIAAPPVAAADAFTLERLMPLLAAMPSSQVPYVEKRYSALLAEPLESSGTLVFERPDRVEKNMAKPRSEGFRIAGQELTLTRDGKQRKVALSREPLLAAFAASLRGVLSGNAALLGEHYRLALEGSEAQWTLELTPIEADIGRHVERIVFSGRAGRVMQIEVREASGDRSVLQVRDR